MNEICSPATFVVVILAIVVFISIAFIVIGNRMIEKKLQKKKFTMKFEPSDESKQEVTDDAIRQSIEEMQGITQVDKNPYMFIIKNSTKENKKAILFGFNKFNTVINYGSDIGVEVNSCFYGTTYIEALNESVSFPFEVGAIRLFSSNIQQLNTFFRFIDHSAKGTSCEIPIITSNYYEKQKRNGAVQEYILDILDLHFKMQSSAWFEFEMLPDTEMTVAIFPPNVLNKINILSDEELDTEIHFYFDNKLLYSQAIPTKDEAMEYLKERYRNRYDVEKASELVLQYVSKKK